MPPSQDPTRLADSSTRRLAVFSHPNHELAAFGLVQRLRPHLLYLTDGGGAARVAETRRGLESIGMAEHARFLDHSEGSFYAALLARDATFFRQIADAVRSEIEAVQAEQGERRGRLLREQGAVEQVITYADHYAPLVSLLGLH